MISSFHFWPKPGNYENARKKTAENDDYLNQNKEYVKSSPELQKQMESNTSYKDQIKVVERMKASDVQYMQKSSKGANYDTRKKR